MFYNDVFCAYKKAEGSYNKESDDLAKSIIDDYNFYIKRLNRISDRISDSKDRILNRPPHLFNGLVIGNVQAGKTMNFCHVINRAIDEGFQLIVIMSSNKDDLNMQTTDRIAKDIVGKVNSKVSQIKSYSGRKNGRDFVNFHSNTMKVGIADSSVVNPLILPNPYPYNGEVNIIDRKPELYWLTACDMGNPGKRYVDFDINNYDNKSGKETFDDFFKYDKDGCYIAVVKKNIRRLKLLYDFLSESKLVKEHKIKALFIDDECDEITVSGKSKNLGQSSVQISDIQKLFETKATDPCHSMYVEYTATPVANICVKNRRNTNTGFPDDFIKIMDKSPKYCGFDAYKKYQDITTIVEPNQINEVDSMSNENIGDYLQYCKENTPQLYRALIQFIINCKIFEERNIANNNTSMLVHTDRKKDVHSNIQKPYIEGVLEAISNQLLNELDDVFSNFNGAYVYGKGWKLIDDFYECFADTQKKMTECQNKGYYKEDSPFDGCQINNYPGEAVFDVNLCLELVSYIIKTLPSRKYNENIKINTGAKKIQVIAVNSNTSNILPNNENFIAVGGNKIARGLTLNNLSVTYFTRQTGALDTLTQMARWFGYRIGYFDICRLYIDGYSSIDDAAKIEADLQKQVRTQNQKGIPSGDMNLIFTGNLPNLLSGKQFSKIEKTFNAIEDYETKNIYSARSIRNKEVLEKFYCKLKEAGYHPEKSGNFGCLSVLPSSKANASRYCYVKNVDYELVESELLDKFISVSNKEFVDILLVAKIFMQNKGTKNVNILLSGRDSSNKVEASFADGEYAVTGMAYKNKADRKTPFIYEIESFGDCSEDYLVDYPDPANLNRDFNDSVNGKLFQNSRSAGYETAIKELCNRYRKDPLIIITPFMFSKTVTIPRLEDNIYYSMRILLPKSYGKCDMVII